MSSEPSTSQPQPAQPAELPGGASCDTIAVIDFETTGMVAGEDRIIEVAAAIVHRGSVIATFAELMNPGCRIPSFITGLTGISQAMIRDCPPPQEVMPRLRAFLGDLHCLAHNAAFDRRFYHAEMSLAGEAHERPFLCSVLLSRRLIQDAPGHRLGTLATHLRLAMPDGMRAHRALADVLITCALWNHLSDRLSRRLAGRPMDLGILHELMRKPKAAISAYLAELALPAPPPRP